MSGLIDYPRPQLRRHGFSILDGEWGFAADPGDEGIAARWYERAEPFSRRIEVPYPPESPASGIGEEVTAPIWYRREFSQQLEDGQRLMLHFEGVDNRASLWVNGIHIGDHQGSQSRFSFDITHAVQAGSNHLVVRAVDPLDIEQPRGKQDWRAEPHAIWYRRTSGIWRTVWLEAVPETRIERIVMTPQQDLAAVGLEARVSGPLIPGLRLETQFRLGERVLAESSSRFISAVIRSGIVLDHDSLDVEPEELWWTPESPTLVEVTARLVHEDVVVDEVSSYLGLRSVSTDGARVLLNSRPYFLRLVLEQGYWPQTHLASPSLQALEQEAKLIKELGFNGIRMHQTSPDPRFLAACDRIGLVVISDTAAAYRFSDIALQRTVSEVLGVVQRDLNHPCVIGWIPFNESWGLPGLANDPAQQSAVQALYSLVKAVDPSRIVIGNDGWHFVAGDLLGIHDYSQDARLLQQRYGTAQAVRNTVTMEQPGWRELVLPGAEARAAAVPVLLSEFGGISSHSDEAAWEAYGRVVPPGDLAERFSELLAAVGTSSGIAGYCYTQLTDTLQEKNGLLTEDREPKCPPELIRSAVLDPRADRHH